MHAPATPGTSDSGSAAGSDSEQGSGSSGNSPEEIGGEPVISSVLFGSNYYNKPVEELDHLVEVTSGENMETYYDSQGDTCVIKVVGSNLDKISEFKAFLRTAQTGKYLLKDFTKSDVSTDSEAYWTWKNVDGAGTVYFGYIRVNGVNYAVNPYVTPEE